MPIHEDGDRKKKRRSSARRCGKFVQAFHAETIDRDVSISARDAPARHGMGAVSINACATERRVGMSLWEIFFARHAGGAAARRHRLQRVIIARNGIPFRATSSR
jgi:hypothetical protein